MPLTTCPECARSVSDAADACPGCGYPVAKMLSAQAANTREPERAMPPPIPVAAAATPAPTRRSPLLALALFALLAGLAYVFFFRKGASSRSSHRAATSIDENGNETPTYAPSQAEPIVDKEVTIKEDAYFASIIDLNRAAVVTVEVELLSGPQVETWLFDEGGFKAFEKAGKALLGGEFRHFPDFHMVDVRHDQRSARLPAKKLYIMVENIDAGSTHPPMNFSEDTAKVRLTVTVE